MNINIHVAYIIFNVIILLYYYSHAIDISCYSLFVHVLFLSKKKKWLCVVLHMYLYLILMISNCKSSNYVYIKYSSNLWLFDTDNEKTEWFLPWMTQNCQSQESKRSKISVIIIIRIDMIMNCIYTDIRACF